MLPAEPTMNILANQSVYGKNSRISWHFSIRFLNISYIFWPFWVVCFEEIVTFFLSLNCSWLHLGKFEDQKSLELLKNLSKGHITWFAHILYIFRSFWWVFEETMMFLSYLHKYICWPQGHKITNAPLIMTFVTLFF